MKIVVVLAVLCTGFSVFAQSTAPAFQPRPAATRGAYGNDIVYYIVIDRFFDGEPGNNIPEFAFVDKPDSTPEQKRWNKLNRLLLPMMYDPTRSYMGMYWGGDLQGIIDKLDYLADLGVTKLVITPVMDNANGFIRNAGADYYLRRGLDDEPPQPDYKEIMTGYHGYWIRDWLALEEHFRNPADEGTDPFRVLRTLLDEAGKRGIGILFDITLNHTTPRSGAWIEQGGVYRGSELLADFSLEKTRKENFGWFHRYFPIDFTNPTKEELETGTLPGEMPDLNQNHPEVQRYLLTAVHFWMDFNRESTPAAGFRVDAIKHMSLSFWRMFEDFLLARWPGLILMGEYFEGGLFNRRSVEFIRDTDFFAQYDFNLSMAAANFFVGNRAWNGRAHVIRQLVMGSELDDASPLDAMWRKASNPGGVLEVDVAMARTLQPGDPKQWGMFVDNHDLPRLRSQTPHLSDDQYLSSIHFLMACPRIPLLLYGVETGLAVPHDPRSRGLFGIGGDPFCRPMMVFPGEPGWNQRIFDETKKAIAMRKAHPVLRYGESTFLFPKGSDPADDIFLARHTKDGPIEVLFAYSTKGGIFPVAVPGGAVATDVITGEVLHSGDGEAALALAPGKSRLITFAPAK